MVPTANLVAFVLAALLLVVLPGPSVLFVIGRALAIGRAGALLSVVGNAFGMFVQVVAIALGLGVILEQSIVLFSIVKFAGAAFLVYLGIQAIRHRNRRATTGGADAPTSRLRSLTEGAGVGVTNPKSVVFFIAVLPQFVDPGAGGVPLQMIELGELRARVAGPVAEAALPARRHRRGRDDRARRGPRGNG
jgi:threonine/homoserine/homoserine lactone efflux protein